MTLGCSNGAVKGHFFFVFLLLLQQVFQQAAYHGAKAILIGGAFLGAALLALGAAAQEATQQAGNVHIAKQRANHIANAGAAGGTHLLAQNAHKQRGEGGKNIAGFLAGNAGLGGYRRSGAARFPAQQVADDFSAVLQIHILQKALDIGGIRLGMALQRLCKALGGVAAFRLLFYAAQKLGKRRGNYLFNILLGSAGSLAQTL